jgi:nucleoside-diphosphate-sugar epimerase
MKALVTGGTGFVGRYVVDALLGGGHRVSVFSRRPELPEDLREAGAEFVHGDLRDFPSVERALEGMDTVFHIGEIKNVTSASAAEMNVELVSFMMEHMRKTRVKRFVFVSTISVAGIPSRTPADEDTEPVMLMHDNYTEYKRKCERLLAEGPEGLEYVILRPAPVYGVGSRYLDWYLRAMEKFAPLGIPLPGGGKSLAPFVHVRDLARAVSLAGTRKEAAGKVFNLTDGISASRPGRSGRTFASSLFPPVLFPLLPVCSIFCQGFSGWSLTLEGMLRSSRGTSISRTPGQPAFSAGVPSTRLRRE